MIVSPEERFEYASLNNICAEKALLSASFQSALTCIKSARQLLTPDMEKLPEFAELVRSISVNLVTTLYRSVTFEASIDNSTAQYSEGLAICEETLSKDFCDQQLEMQIAIHQCRILTFMGKTPECVARGLNALSFFQPRLSALLTDPVATNAYETELLEDIIRMTKDCGINESFNRLPVLQDKFLLAAHSLLVEMLAPSAFAAPHLIHTLPLIGVILSLKHGKCIHSAVHVSNFIACLMTRCRCWLLTSRILIDQTRIGQLLSQH